MIKMGPRCETIGKYVLPVFRSLVAKELIGTYNLTQIETAQKLGTTQATISQYINSKRALESIGHIDKLLPQIDAMARKIAKRLANSKMAPEEVLVDFCRLCSSFCEVESSQISDDCVI